MENFIGKIKTIAVIISAAFILWFCLSYAEIISKNNTENPTYNRYNLFEIAFSEDRR